MRALLIGVLGIVAIALPVTAQTLVTTSASILHSEPTSKSKGLAWLDVRDTVYQIEAERINGYLQVRLDTLEGWISARRVREVAEPSVPSSVVTTNVMPLMDVSTAHHKACPLGGQVGGSGHQSHTDSLKNRTAGVTPSDIDAAVTLATMLKTGNDVNRFDEGRAAEVIGYVDSVKNGGQETVNCKSPYVEDYDTHIELSQTVGAPGPQRVIVEITPRMRSIAKQQGLDWSTDAIRSQIQHRWVRVTGWLLWDYHHSGQSQHTKKPTTKASSIWRATAWEIHPITSLKVCAGGKATC
jgi:hypothetical protein